MGSLDLESGKVFRFQGAAFRFPGFSFGLFDVIDGALWTGDETAYAMVNNNAFPHRESRLYRLSLSQPAEAIGPPLLGGTLIGLSGEAAVATACEGDGGVWTLDISRPGEWSLFAGPECIAALSPDGKSVALSSDGGRSLWRRPLSGAGRPVQLLSLRDVTNLRRAGFHDPRITRLLWGRQGLAVTLQEGETGTGPFALVVLEPDGTLRVAPLGSGNPQQLAWQPGGNLLAFTSCGFCRLLALGQQVQGELRVYDVRSGRLEQVAASSDHFLGLVWSPDGRTLVSRWRGAEVLFANPSTGTLERRSLDAIPWDWRA